MAWWFGPALRWIAITVVLAVTAGVLGLVGVTLGAVRYEATLAVLFRTMLAVVALLTVSAYAVRHWPDHSRWFYLSSAAGAYLLLPLAWTGQALLAQLFLAPGVLTFAVDLLVWLLLVWAVVSLERRREEPPTVDQAVRDLLR